MPFKAATHGITVVVTVETFSGIDQVDPWSEDDETNIPCRSVHTVYSFPFEGSTASVGQKFARSVKSGAW